MRYIFVCAHKMFIETVELREWGPVLKVGITMLWAGDPNWIKGGKGKSQQCSSLFPDEHLMAQFDGWLLLKLSPCPQTVIRNQCLLNHLSKNVTITTTVTRDVVSEGLANGVSEWNMNCIDIGLDSIHVSFWLKIPLYSVCALKTWVRLNSTAMS